jgi:hypothetical protein
VEGVREDREELSAPWNSVDNMYFKCIVFLCNTWQFSGEEPNQCLHPDSNHSHLLSSTGPANPLVAPQPQVPTSQNSQSTHNLPISNPTSALTHELDAPAPLRLLPKICDLCHRLRRRKRALTCVCRLDLQRSCIRPDSWGILGSGVREQGDEQMRGGMPEEVSKGGQDVSCRLGKGTRFVF